ncbi:MAG: DUF4252 domain-containing protein [Variovorax sp.]|nr:MAG: DUF4252 domain-containing protein [Variovorax sp.]
MKLAALTLSLLAAPLVAWADGPRLDLPDFSRLAAKATQTVDINLDGDMLKTAGQFMGGASGQQADVNAALEGLKGVYVRVFTFDDTDRSLLSELDVVRRQLQAPSWKKAISMQQSVQHVDLFMHEDNGRPEDGGLAILITQPNQLVIVNLVGKVDLEKLRQLQGKLGVPSMPGVVGVAPAPATK